MEREVVLFIKMINMLILGAATYYDQYDCTLDYFLELL